MVIYLGLGMKLLLTLLDRLSSMKGEPGFSLLVTLCLGKKALADSRAKSL